MELQLQKEGVKLKLLIKSNNKELSKYLNFTNSFLYGLKDYSVSYYELSIEDIKEGFEKNDIKIENRVLHQIFDGLNFHMAGKINYSEFLSAMVSVQKTKILA